MKNNSALGSDGYTVEFYKTDWKLIGLFLMEDIVYFFTNSFIYHLLNSTVVSLISKVDALIRIKDFRLISCCNVSYTVIWKILTNIIKDEKQLALINRRSIQENILLMHKLVKKYQKIGGPSSGVIKVDIMKVFDNVK